MEYKFIVAHLSVNSSEDTLDDIFLKATLIATQVKEVSLMSSLM